MKKIATWLVAGVIVAAASGGCTVEATTTGGAGTGGTGGSGATGGSGGTTGGSSGSGGTAGTDSTGGSSGSSGAAGAAGSGGSADAGGDVGSTCTMPGAADPACIKCAYNKCQMEHCSCNAVSTCRSPMLTFYTCISAPNADEVGCAQTFITNANVDGSGGGLANDLATCMLSDCTDTCQGRDASTRNSNLVEALKAALGRSNPR